LTHPPNRYKLFPALALRKLCSRSRISFGRFPPWLRSRLIDLGGSLAAMVCAHRHGECSHGRPPRSLRPAAPPIVELTMEVLERIWEVLAGIINSILGRFERAITVLF